MAIAGVSPRDYDHLTWDELSAILLRVRKNEEQQDRLQWERARQMSFAICGPYLKKGTALKQFWPLPWDKKEVKPASTIHSILQKISK